jgi:UDP-sulfoquinovose synthase
MTNPPQIGSQPMVLNQITETHRVADLAKIVSEITGAEIANLPNPRREATRTTWSCSTSSSWPSA